MLHMRVAPLDDMPFAQERTPSEVTHFTVDENPPGSFQRRQTNRAINDRNSLQCAVRRRQRLNPTDCEKFLAMARDKELENIVTPAVGRLMTKQRSSWRHWPVNASRSRCWLPVMGSLATSDGFGWMTKRCKCHRPCA
jgi:hypothetical protein